MARMAPMARDKRPLHEIGTEPDVRFSYANERTFLAWNRTAMALIATGLAATSVLPEFSFAGGRRLIGVPLVVLGAWLALTSYTRWNINERAMREGRPLPPSTLPKMLAIGVGVAGVIAAIVAAVGAK